MKFRVSKQAGFWIEFGNHGGKPRWVDFIRAQGICPRMGTRRNYSWIKIHAVSDALPIVLAMAAGWAIGADRLWPWVVAGLGAGMSGMGAGWLSNSMVPHVLKNWRLGVSRGGKILRVFQVAAYVLTASSVFTAALPWTKKKSFKPGTEVSLTQERPSMAGRRSFSNVSPRF